MKVGKVKKIGDYDVWYKPCSKCGFDTGKSTVPKEGNKTCWKCGNSIQRDYSDRALKPIQHKEQQRDVMDKIYDEICDEEAEIDSLKREGFLKAEY
jgi:hypothetical protein